TWALVTSSMNQKPCGFRQAAYRSCKQRPHISLFSMKRPFCRSTVLVRGQLLTSTQPTTRARRRTDRLRELRFGLRYGYGSGDGYGVTLRGSIRTRTYVTRRNLLTAA